MAKRCRINPWENLELWNRLSPKAKFLWHMLPNSVQKDCVFATNKEELLKAIKICRVKSVIIFDELYQNSTRNQNDHKRR